MSRKQAPYQKRMNKLFMNFRDLLVEMDSLVAVQEERFLEKESKIHNLEKQEQALAKKINRLHQLPQHGIVVVNNQLQKLIIEQEQDSKRSRQRDYLLFVLSLFAPFIISWITQLLGNKW